MPQGRGKKLAALGLVIAITAVGPTTFRSDAESETPNGLLPIDVRLPSDSTGIPGGTLVVRVYSPRPGRERYPGGAPILIWVPGGADVGRLPHGLPPDTDDIVCITFLFPGGEDPRSGLASDGTFDYRGPSSIAALRDVVRYAGGGLHDADGRGLADVTPATVVPGNIGLVGESNGGNIIAAVSALHGAELAGMLRYLIAWESPVSSQIATRDFGRVWLKPSPQQGDYCNPRYGGYDRFILPSIYDDLVYDPASEPYPLFHDGNGDGKYTTVARADGILVPDLNGDGRLDSAEDFPLDAYPVDGERVAYSRPVTEALQGMEPFATDWPEHIASPAEAAGYWDLRESVRLAGAAAAAIPGLEVMILCGARDHVQSLPDKPHIRQAFDSWRHAGVWVRINPTRDALYAVDPSLRGRPLPELRDGAPPGDWARHTTYAMPPDLPKAIYELAAIYQMADRVEQARTESQ
ncbi:MAG: hypothetical protein JSW65_04785 [Candidatus Bipolaricaulota bacterium]|nr:MAG: hypothetical protein JSW65_04785 [Candidatus Bipolaricaulota bacterium]